MCAIAGIVNFSVDAEPPVNGVRAMLRRMKHRGPDGSAVNRQVSCVLGANRLAQLDTAGGGQPMTSPDGRWMLVFNGEIHNYRGLRECLADEWEFVTKSDTEVLLAALVTWGKSALTRLNGMFAFFLWDTLTCCGFAARDRLGVKPLVWTRMGNGLAFASEAKALLEVMPGRPAVNVGAVLEYFAAPCFSGVAAPMFADMHTLPPGHWLTVDASGIHTEEWWRYDFSLSGAEDETRLLGEMRALLPQAVRRTLDTEEPAAVFLSGGLDSTLVAACGKPHGVSCGYTIAFEGQAEFDYARGMMVKSDDLPFAGEAAWDLGMEHRIVPVSRTSMAEDLRVIAIQNDALPAWEQELAQHHLARAASADYRAVLVGDAADETHFGYPFLLVETTLRHPRDFLRAFGEPPLARGMEEEAGKLMDGYADSMEAAGYAPDSRVGRLRGISHLIMQRWLPRLLHNGDIHTMAHGVEARVPFADADLLALAVQVHPELALRGGIEKSLLREAARGLMPEAARKRRKSSLTKDDACAAIYQMEAAKALEASGKLLSTWLDVGSLRRLCDSRHVPLETERALLFRVICCHHWATAYNITLP